MRMWLKLFVTFARIGVFMFGGGLAMLPLMQRELVDGKGWITQEEMINMYAVGQCTPGIIAVNTATFVGYKQGGSIGGVAATLGLVFPGTVTITAIAGVLERLVHIPQMDHAFVGIRACVCALIFSSAIQLMKTAVVDIPSGVLCCAALVAAVWLGLSPALVVLAGGVLGLVVDAVRRRRK